MSQSRYTLQLGLAILWMAAVLLIYYVIHKPITTALVSSVGAAVLQISITLVLFAIGGGLGRRFLADRLGDLSLPEALAIQSLTGVGLLSVLLLSGGVVIFSTASVVVTLLVAIIFAGWHTIDWARELLLWVLKPDYSAVWSRRLAVFIGLNLAMALIMALAPETKFDALVYHLVGPKLWLAEGQIVALPDSHFFGFPALVNMLYAAHMALLGGDTTGTATIHAMFGVLLMLAMGGYGARRFRAEVGWFAAAFLFTVTSAWLAFAWSYVDLATAAYGMVAYIALDMWRDAQTEPAGRRWIIVAGVLVGLAMSTKYNAVLLGVAAGLYILVYGARGGVGRAVQAGGLMVVVASLVLLPWLVRNWAFYDNPIYPLGPTTETWDELQNEWYTGANRAPFRVEPRFAIPIFLTPTFLGIEGADPFNGTLGPIFLLLIPLLAITWHFLDDPTRGRLKPLLLMVLIFHVFWLITSTLSQYGLLIRFMYPMLGWAVLLAAAAFDSLRLLPKKPLDFNWMARVLVSLVLLFALVDNFAGTRPADNRSLDGSTLSDHFLATQAAAFLVGVIDEEAYLDRNLGWQMETIRQLNDLPDDSHVYFLWETRSLYCDEPRITCEEDTALFHWWHDRRTIGDGSAEAILDAWRAEGITHVVVWEAGQTLEFDLNPKLTRDDEAEWNHMESLLGLVWDGDGIYTLYALPDEE